MKIRTESKWNVDAFKNLRDGHQHLGKFKWGSVYPLRLQGSDPEWSAGHWYKLDREE